jgi:hypothetical protein
VSGPGAKITELKRAQNNIVRGKESSSDETKNNSYWSMRLSAAIRRPLGELVVAYDGATASAENRYDACATIAHYTGERQ